MSKVQFPNRNGKNNSNYRHGFSNHPLWFIYSAMIQRCYNPNDQRYDDYGGRAIKVCDEWRNDKTDFFRWALNSGWRKGLTIDRENNDLGYSPSNCRLVDNIRQARNKRNTVMVTYNSETMSLRDWCDRLDLPFVRTYTRIYREKLSPDEAFTRPSRYNPTPK